jgi:hypothetical protein
MEAKRASLALLLTVCASLAGCAMLQPGRGASSDKSTDTKPKEPPEVVRKPTSRPTAEDESSNAIVQWAKGAMKARETPHAQEAHPASSGPPELAADGAPGEVFDAKIPVRSADSAPGGVGPPPLREVAVRREQPPASVQPGAHAPSAKSAPPALGAVTVRSAAREPSPRQSRTSNAKIALNDPESADGGDENLKDLLDDALAQPGDASFREQLDRKMLLVMKGEYEKAREPFVLASQAQQEMGRRLLEALIAIREGHGGDPGGEAADVLAQVNQLRESLLKVSDLSLPTFAICRAVRGFGQYEPVDPPRFVAGRENEFVAYCEIRDFVSEQRDDAFVSNFAQRRRSARDQRR